MGGECIVIDGIGSFEISIQSDGSLYVPDLDQYFKEVNNAKEALITTFSN